MREKGLKTLNNTYGKERKSLWKEALVAVVEGADY